MNTGAMSEHTLDDGGVALLNDIDMDDFIDLAEALLVESAPHEPDNANDDADAMVVVEPQGLSAEASTNQTQDYATDHASATHDVDATRADPEATPKQQDHAVSDDDAVRPCLEQFETTFATQEVELKSLAPPPQCAQFPGQEEDILEAYLDHATFTAKIWVNFDAAENLFFEGTRAAACGKLQIPTAKLDFLLGMDAKEVNFRKVRLDICTPFRTLARIYMNIRENHGCALLDVDGEMVQQQPRRALTPLRDFLGNCVGRLHRAGCDDNLSMHDLVEIARLFRRRHENDQDEDKWEKPCYEGGEWAGVEEPLRGIRW